MRRKAFDNMHFYMLGRDAQSNYRIALNIISGINFPLFWILHLYPIVWYSLITICRSGIIQTLAYAILLNIKEHILLVAPVCVLSENHLLPIVYAWSRKNFEGSRFQYIMKIFFLFMQIMLCKSIEIPKLQIRLISSCISTKMCSEL